MCHTSVTVRLITILTPFTAKAQLLLTEKKACDIGLSSELLNTEPSRSCFPMRSAFLNVLALDTGTEIGISVVCAANDFGLIGPRLRWYDGSERLLLDDLGVVRCVVDDQGLNKETLGLGELGVVGFGVLERILEYLVLCGVWIGPRRAPSSGAPNSMLLLNSSCYVVVAPRDNMFDFSFRGGRTLGSKSQDGRVGCFEA